MYQLSVCFFRRHVYSRVILLSSYLVSANVIACCPIIPIRDCEKSIELVETSLVYSRRLILLLPRSIATVYSHRIKSFPFLCVSKIFLASKNLIWALCQWLWWSLSWGQNPKLVYPPSKISRCLSFLCFLFFCF